MAPRYRRLQSIKYGVNVAVLRQIGLLGLPDTWRTPREQYGGMFFFPCVYTFEYMATVSFHFTHWVEFFSSMKLLNAVRGLENGTRHYINMVVSSKWVEFTHRGAKITAGWGSCSDSPEFPVRCEPDMYLFMENLLALSCCAAFNTTVYVELKHV